MTGSTSTQSLAATSRRWRWGIVVLGLVVFAVVGPALGWYEPVCEEQLSAAGEAVTVCRPLAFGDLPVLAGGLLILLLLWPDLSEVSIGLVSLKRLVEEKAVETAEKVDTAAQETDRRIDALRIEMKADMSQAVMASQNMHLHIGDRDLTVEGIREVTEHARTHEPGEPLDRTFEERDRVALAPNVVFLLDWALVEGVLEWADKGRVYRQSGDLAYLSVAPGPLLGINVPDDRVVEIVEVVDTASTMFSAVLMAGRSTRNVLTHMDSVIIGLDTLSSLSEQLQGFLGHVQRRVEAQLGSSS